MSNQLILKRPETQTGPVTFDQLSTFVIDHDADHVVKRNEMISRSSEIELVNSDQTQQIAVDRLNEMKKLVRDVEATRKEVNGPLASLKKTIDASAKSFVEPLEREIARLNACVTVRLKQQEAERIAAEKERREMLAKLEAERIENEAKALAATTVEEVIAVQEATKKIEAAQTVAIVQKEQPKVVGLVNRKIPQFDIESIEELVKSRPDLCDITPSRSRISAAIRDGMTQCPGLKNIRIETEAGTRN